MALITTQANNDTKLLAANSTQSGGFASKIITLTEPAASSTAGVIEVADPSGSPIAPNSILLKPFGAGSDGNTFAMRVWGWSYDGAAWTPHILAEFTCTLCANVGLAGASITASDRLVDTLTVVTNMGNANVDYIVTSPQNDTLGHVVVDLKGCQKVEVAFNVATATSANTLYRFV